MELQYAGERTAVSVSVILIFNISKLKHTLTLEWSSHTNWNIHQKLQGRQQIHLSKLP